MPDLLTIEAALSLIGTQGGNGGPRRKNPEEVDWLGVGGNRDSLALFSVLSGFRFWATLRRS
jgi:hypothetical protein